MQIKACILYHLTQIIITHGRQHLRMVIIGYEKNVFFQVVLIESML